MTELLRHWLVSPRAWNEHPYAYGWGMLAGLVVLVGMALVFWIKGKFWP
jgi:hypothetical protein